MGCVQDKEGNPFGETPLPGVHLSPQFKFYDALSMMRKLDAKSEFDGVKSDGDLGAWMSVHLLNKNRDDEHYGMLANEISKNLGHGVEKNSHDFQTVPTKVTKDTLAHLFRGNPFLASAIHQGTMPNSGPRLCLNSHTLPGDRSKPNFFQKLTSCMHTKWDRFRIVLTDNLEIESVIFYRYSVEGKWETIELDSEQQIKVVTSTLMFYFQCVHANLHILHFMMVCGLYTVTRNNSKLEAFASPYLPNIILKYEEVQTLLLSEDGALVKGFCEGNRPKLLSVLTEMLSCWGNCKGSKQFVETFLFPLAFDARAKSLAPHDVWVPQFRIQSNLVPAFAADVTEHMRGDADYALKSLDAALERFFNECGRGIFAVTSLQQWLELMSVTGMLHGCTLSLTRVTFTEANLWQMALDSDKFTPYTIEQMGTAFGTLVGLDDDREVFTDKGLDADPELKSIVHKHLEKSNVLKKAYADSLDKAGQEFKTWGWILTDYFPDLFDAKQLTITTYV